MFPQSENYCVIPTDLNFTWKENTIPFKTFIHCTNNFFAATKTNNENFSPFIKEFSRKKVSYEFPENKD